MEKEFYSLEFWRRSTFIENKVNLKKNLCISLAKNGYYYDCNYKMIKCCMGCSDYSLKDVSEKENNFNLLHKTCSFQPTIIRSKIFLNLFLHFLYEKERLSSFIECPFSHIIDPKTLAKNGFIYERYSDVCLCVFCEKRIHIRYLSNDYDNDIDKLHKHISPTCPIIFESNKNRINDINISLETSNILDSLILQGDNYPLATYYNKNNELWRDDYEKTNHFKHLGAITFKKNRFEKYISYEKRRKSFDNIYWKPERIQQDPNKLAKAGFFYLGEY